MYRGGGGGEDCQDFLKCGELLLGHSLIIIK